MKVNFKLIFIMIFELKIVTFVVIFIFLFYIQIVQKCIENIKYKKFQLIIILKNSKKIY